MAVPTHGKPCVGIFLRRQKCALNPGCQIHESSSSGHRLQRRAVGTEGMGSISVPCSSNLNQRATLGDLSGSWTESVASVNALIDDLVHPTSETARVIGAVAQGDLSQTMALETDDRPLQGEFLRTAKIVNRMVDQLGSFASEVTRVAREVGTEGKLGGQARVEGVSETGRAVT